MNAMDTLENLKHSDRSTYDINELEKNCYDAMDDDFNTPILIAHLFDGVRIINSVKDGKESLTASDLSKMQKLFSDFVTDILDLFLQKKVEGMTLLMK